jgi:hypothetical protein
MERERERERERDRGGGTVIETNEICHRIFLNDIFFNCISFQYLV